MRSEDIGKKLNAGDISRRPPAIPRNILGEKQHRRAILQSALNHFFVEKVRQSDVILQPLEKLLRGDLQG